MILSTTYSFKRGNSSNKILQFSKIVRFDGENIDEIRAYLKKFYLDGAIPLVTNIHTRDEYSDFIRLVKADDVRYIYINYGDYICMKKHDVVVYTEDFIDKYYTLKGNSLIPNDEFSES